MLEKVGIEYWRTNLSKKEGVQFTNCHQACNDRLIFTSNLFQQPRFGVFDYNDQLFEQRVSGKKDRTLEYEY